MRSLIDTKPIGAFIEYTVKPLIDNAHDLIELLDKHGIKASSLDLVWKIYLFNCVLNFFTTLIVTGMICLTIYFIALNSLPINP